MAELLFLQCPLLLHWALPPWLVVAFLLALCLVLWSRPRSLQQLLLVEVWPLWLLL